MACPRAHICHVCQIFSCRIYIDSNHRDTCGYEWLLVLSCHLVVIGGTRDDVDKLVIDDVIYYAHRYGYIVVVIASIVCYRSGCKHEHLIS
jgi:hypothetical protein